MSDGLAEQPGTAAALAAAIALDELDENNIVSLDEERKAAMVSNLLVVLCSDEAAQPVLNTSTLYT